MSQATHVLKVCALAPMMGYTDVHFRYMVHVLAPQVWLYTEMIPAAALLRRAACDRFLRHDPHTAPTIAQLGGSDPKVLEQAALRVKQAGFKGVDLNLGCPSARVQAGAFGACLMLQPSRVREALHALQAHHDLPVSVKIRIGVDQHDSLAWLLDFVGGVRDAGCRRVTVHARRAVLSWSPKANRRVPPLRYDRVYAVKRCFPDMQIVLNGGVSHPREVARHAPHVDGVMLGRVLLQHITWITDFARQCDHVQDQVPTTWGDLTCAYHEHMQRCGAANRPMRTAHKRPWLSCFKGQQGAGALRAAWAGLDSWDAARRWLEPYAHVPLSRAVWA